MNAVFTSPAVLTVAFGCALIGLLAALAVFDVRRMILPNYLNLTLAGTGLAQSSVLGRPTLFDAAVGALAGAAVLAVIGSLFRHLRGIDGLGLGDRKFVAAAGLWIGWQELAPMLLYASVGALAFVAFSAARTRTFDPATRLPFGPFLGLGTFVVWLTTAMGEA